ncbi:MAG TPA: hypothetical protein VEX86_26515 [Longimicrobium sp.]|nr:hypothetical protein [Longimicrobium sp.]
MINPESARTVLREYHATTPIEEQIEDVRRYSPELAERLGLSDARSNVRVRSARGIRGFLASVGRSVHNLFSRVYA